MPDLLEENERLQGVVASLLEQIALMEATNRDFVARYVQVEQQSANLANLYVASYRLHGSLDRDEVIEVLQEILINLVGSEEFAVYEREGESASMRVVSCFGVDTARV